MSIVVSGTPIQDLSNNLKSLVEDLPRYVSIDFLSTKSANVRGKDYQTNHYPLHDMLKIDSLVKESHLIDNIQSAILMNLTYNIENVLLSGKFASSVNGDIDWHKESNVKRKQVKQDNIEDYFKSLGYEDLYFYNESFKPVSDMAWNEYSYQKPKTVAFPANIDMVRVAFSPANRFSTVNTISKPAYLFKYTNEEKGCTDYMYESNFIVILDKPELIVDVI